MEMVVEMIFRTDVDPRGGLMLGRLSSPMENALSSVREAYSESIKRPIRVGIDCCELWFTQIEVVTT
jgi:hypothetical protein